MDSIGKRFLEQTKYENLGISDQSSGKPQPPLQLEYDKTQSIIKLTDPSEIKTEFVDVRKTIEQRRSVRSYSEEPLSIEQLSYLLWCTQGVKKIVKGKVTFRNVPSAGARHAFETYLLINKVNGITPGLYRFLALENSLINVLLDDEITDKITEVCCKQNHFIKSSAVTFIWVAVTERMNWRYEQRGYRYLYLDAGHVCQNLYISAESINCGTCAIGAYSDDELNQLLGLDGKEQFVIYLATVGKKQVISG